MGSYDWHGDPGFGVIRIRWWQVVSKVAVLGLFAFAMGLLVFELFQIVRWLVFA